MPTAGKSTVGVMLARLMRYNFTDTDIVIQVNNDATLAELIARHGNERFLGHRERGHPDDRAGAHRGVRPAAARYTATTPLRSLRATGPVVYSSSCRWAALTRRMGEPKGARRGAGARPDARRPARPAQPPLRALCRHNRGLLGAVAAKDRRRRGRRRACVVCRPSGAGLTPGVSGLRRNVKMLPLATSRSYSCKHPCPVGV